MESKYEAMVYQVQRDNLSSNEVTHSPRINWRPDPHTIELKIMPEDQTVLAESIREATRACGGADVDWNSEVVVKSLSLNLRQITAWCHSGELDVEDDRLLMSWIETADGVYICAAPTTQTADEWNPLIDLIIPESIIVMPVSLGDISIGCLGYSLKSDCYVGWTHRAHSFFRIGDTMSIGIIGFVPSNLDELMQCTRDWYEDDFETTEKYRTDYKYSLATHYDEGLQGHMLVVKVHATYTDRVPNEKLRGKPYDSEYGLNFKLELIGPDHADYDMSVGSIPGIESSVQVNPNAWGRGEYTAETLEDTKQMALAYIQNLA